MNPGAPEVLTPLDETLLGQDTSEYGSEFVEDS